MQSLLSGGNFAATYTLKKGSAKGTGDCDKLPHEVLYFGSFYQKNGDNTPNYDKVSVGVQPASTVEALGNAQGAMVTPNPDDRPYAYGKFEGPEPDADDFCTVPKLSPARLRLPVAPTWEALGEDGMSQKPPVFNPERPKTDFSYTFSSLKVYMTVSSPGRQVTGNFTYHLVQGDNVDCTAEYTVRALFPATPCGLDDMGMPIDAKKANEACRDNPVFQDDAVECDSALHMCVLSKAVPSLR